jgi:hypothetical protein
MDDDGFQVCTTYRDFVTTFFPSKDVYRRMRIRGKQNPEFLTFFPLFDNFEGLGVQFLPL